MPNYFNIPKISPIVFKPVRSGTNWHLDSAWFCDQIEMFQQKYVRYHQKWERDDNTDLEIESSIMPNDLQVIDINGQVVKTFEWLVTFTATSYKVYRLHFDISDLDDGFYWCYQVIDFLSVHFEAISEPLHLQEKWPGTERIRYKHSYNDYDVAWITGTEMAFRCELVMPKNEVKPDNERTTHVNQINSITTLKGVAFETFKLYVGGTGASKDKGVAPYVPVLLNRIFLCDWVKIAGRLYQASEGAKIETTPIKGWPLVTASIEIEEQFNIASLQFADTSPLSPGIVTAYNISTTFFGPGAIVPVTEVEHE